MFSPALRILLIAGSLLTLGFMLSRIRAAKVQIADSVFWILFSAAMLLLSVFPDIPAALSRLFGIQSPINFVYLFIIFILLIKLFFSTVRLSQLDAQVKQLAQRTALHEKAQSETPAPASGRQAPSPKDEA